MTTKSKRFKAMKTREGGSKVVKGKAQPKKKAADKSEKDKDNAN